MGVPAALVAVFAILTFLDGASAAVTLRANNNKRQYTIRHEPISKATFTYRNSEPVLLWGEASVDAPASNSESPVAAYATYNRAAHNATGWGQLWITTTTEVPMLEAMFAAGYLEGALTHDTMHDFYLNEIYDWFVDQPVPPALLQFLEDNLKWTRVNAGDVAQHSTPEQRAFWGAISLSLAQLDGLVAGYNAHCPPENQLTTAQILMLSADGDLESIVPVFAPSANMVNRRAGTTRCSALVKFLEDKSDIYMGHATWDHYHLMLRTLKTYNISLECNPDYTATSGCERYQRSMTFSSSPGFLWSLDDWYVTDNGLVVTETTNNDYTNMSKEKLRVDSVLSWMRGMAANWLATTPKDWSLYFSMHNSGTYNSQWMILDYKMFTPHKELPAGAFYVLEQATSFVEVMDATDILNKDGYWGSYNVPYFPKVYKVSGFDEMFKKEGDEFSYQKCARAKIFKERQAGVKDLDSFKRLMRLNEYQNDPLSEGQPGLAIAGRWDLATNKEKFQLDGAIDAKACNAELARRLMFVAQNGPTHDTQPVFTWKHHDKEAHYGMPDEFDFGWVIFGPSPPPDTMSIAEAVNVLPSAIVANVFKLVASLWSTAAIR